MQLTTLTVAGLKGQQGAHTLRGVDLFAGPNGAGKTTRLLAVQAGLAGGRFPFLPGDCKDYVQVGLTFAEPAVTIARTMSPKHAVSVMPGPSGVRRATAWIAEHIGSPGIGVADFLGLSPAQRQMRLLALVRELPAGVPTTADEIDRALPIIAGLSPMDDYGANASAACQILERAIKTLRSEKSTRERDAKTLERGLAELASADEDAPEGTLRECIDDHNRLAGELAETKGTLKGLRKLGGAFASARTRAQEHRAAADTAAVQLAELRAQLPDMGPLQAAYDTAARHLRQHQRAVDASAATHTEAAAALDALEATERRYIAGDDCVTCGRALDSDCDGLIGVRAKLDQRRAGLAMLVAERDAAEAQHADAVDAETAASRALRAARGAAEPVMTQIATLDSGRACALAAADEADKALAGIPPDADPQLLTLRVEALELDLEAVATRRERLERAQAREEERARKVAARDQHREIIDDVKAALAQLTEWRATIVAQASEWLAELANQVASDVFPGLSFAAVATSKGSDLQLRRGAGPGLPLQAWADSEVLVFGVAAHVALMQGDPPPWRVIMVDEVQKLDPRTLAAFVVAMARLVDQGALDNVLLAGAITDDHRRVKPRLRDPAVLGRIHTHELGERAGEARAA